MRACDKVFGLLVTLIAAVCAEDKYDYQGRRITEPDSTDFDSLQYFFDSERTHFTTMPTLDFGNHWYWEKYWDPSYKRVGKWVDWFGEWFVFKNMLGMPKPEDNPVIFFPGCGSSKLPDDLYKDGYKNIVAVDFVSNLIADMKKRFPHIGYFVSDVGDLTGTHDDTYDVIIDKALLDTQFMGKEEGRLFRVARTNRMVAEFYRILKPGGIYVVISDKNPEMVNEFFHHDHFHWDSTHSRVDAPRGMDRGWYEVYVNKKRFTARPGRRNLRELKETPAADIYKEQLAMAPFYVPTSGDEVQDKRAYKNWARRKGMEHIHRIQHFENIAKGFEF